MSAQHLAALRERLDPVRGGTPAVLVSVARTQGSVPREEGAWMAVFASEVINTLGGGRLEFDAIARARALLAAGPGAMHPQDERHALGPSLGQCCGGVVHLRYERLEGPLPAARAVALMPASGKVALFGGGHVGRALVHVLGTLPLAVRWIDSRDEIFPTECPANVECEHSNPVHAAVAELAAGSRVLVMSFSHAEDLDVVQACLKRLRERNDLPYVGLIGSASKWASFRHRLRERGYRQEELDRVTCPIGLPGIAGKQPEVIAVAVAAQLLLQGETSTPHAG